MSARKQLRFRTRIRQAARRAGWHLAPAGQFDLTERSYYSPLVDLDDPDWTHVSAMLGINFDVDAQFDWAERELAGHITEYVPLEDGNSEEPRFYVHNGSYQTGDGEVLYAMIRRYKPGRIVELGSGFSTLVTAEAVLANEREGHPARFIAYNPHPPANIAGHVVPGLAAHEPVRAQDVPADVFTNLQANDVLFVDTTHTVKVGSEVNRIILDVLPRLAPGVLVHFHDIWLPDEYPRALIEEVGHAWAEQYLLQAFLAFNPRWRVLMALWAMRARDPDRFARLVPSYDQRHYPTGFWLIAE